MYLTLNNEKKYMVVFNVKKHKHNNNAIIFNVINVINYE